MNTGKKRGGLRIAALILTGVLLMALSGGCSLLGKKYQVSYDNKSAYQGAKDAYRVGARVKLSYPLIAADTDYDFIVTGADGTEIRLEPSTFPDIIFIMPGQNVQVRTECRNSMAMENRN